MSIKHYWLHEKLNVERENLKTEGTHSGYVALLAPRTRYNSRNGMELTDTYQTRHPFSYRTVTRYKKKQKKKRRSDAQAKNMAKPRGALIAFSVSFFGDGRYRSRSESRRFRENKQPGGWIGWRVDETREFFSFYTGIPDIPSIDVSTSDLSVPVSRGGNQSRGGCKVRRDSPLRNVTVDRDCGKRRGKKKARKPKGSLRREISRGGTTFAAANLSDNVG